MRFSQLLGAVSTGALVLSMASAAQAATFGTPEYTVTYDDSTSFGAIVGNGGGSDGINQHLSFSWDAPFSGSTGHDPVVIAAGGVTTFDLPSFTLTAASGYEFSALRITLGGAVYTFAGTSTASFGTLTYAGPDGNNGTWTLAGSLTSGPFNTYTFSGGTLTLSAPTGVIFATKGPEVLFNVTAVPEPEGFALALAGTGVALLVLRRRQRA